MPTKDDARPVTERRPEPAPRGGPVKRTRGKANTANISFALSFLGTQNGIHLSVSEARRVVLVLKLTN